MPDRSHGKRWTLIYVACLLLTSAVLTVLNYAEGKTVAQVGVVIVSLAWAWTAVLLAARQRRERGPRA
jgi:4-hydroxybenzoate polyprenyltransferase